MVNAQPMKSSMIHHINACIHAILNVVQQRNEQSYAALTAKFAELEGRMLRVAQSTEECLQLIKDVADAKSAVEQMNEELARNLQADLFLERYRCFSLIVCVVSAKLSALCVA